MPRLPWRRCENHMAKKESDLPPAVLTPSYHAPTAGGGGGHVGGGRTETQHQMNENNMPSPLAQRRSAAAFIDGEAEVDTWGLLALADDYPLEPQRSPSRADVTPPCAATSCSACNTQSASSSEATCASGVECTALEVAGACLVCGTVQPSASCPQAACSDKDLFERGTSESCGEGEGECDDDEGSSLGGFIVPDDVVEYAAPRHKGERWPAWLHWCPPNPAILERRQARNKHSLRHAKRKERKERKASLSVRTRPRRRLVCDSGDSDDEGDSLESARSRKARFIIGSDDEE